MEIVEALRRDQEAVRHPADGGGEVRFLGEPEAATVSKPGRWAFVYSAGTIGDRQARLVVFSGTTLLGMEHSAGVVPRRLGLYGDDDFW